MGKRLEFKGTIVSTVFVSDELFEAMKTGTAELTSWDDPALRPTDAGASLWADTPFNLANLADSALDNEVHRSSYDIEWQAIDEETGDPIDVSDIDLHA